MTVTTTLGPEEARTFATSALTRCGADQTQAEALARGIVAAELDGVRSHGFAYLPTYCEHLLCGKVKKQPTISVLRKSDVAFLVDADCGFAHAAIEAGFAVVIPAAKAHGIAAVGIVNSYNCGVLGFHVDALARKGLLALGFTNAPASIAPVGGMTPVIGTNPIACAVPGGDGEPLVVIDQSASVVAKSELIGRAREARAIPEGWALDPQGRPTTDPAEGLKGTMVPAGGHKGFGAGLIVEIFAAALTGATLGIDASPFSGTDGGPPRTGQFFIAIDPRFFAGDLFAARIADLVEAIARQPGTRVPGQRRRASREASGKKGIEIAEDLRARIEQICRRAEA